MPLGGLVALSALVRAVGCSRGVGGGLGRHPFVLLAAGLSLTICSEGLAAVAGSTASDWVNPIALAAYPFLIAGLVVLNASRVREEALDTVLVAAIVPSTLFAFGWMPLTEQVQRWTGSEGQASWTSWLLLAVDTLAVAIVARLAVLFRGKPIAYQMLLVAMACMLGAHIARVIGVATGAAPAPFGAQALMLVSFAMTAGASLHPSMRVGGATRTRVDSIGRTHLFLLVTVVLVGPAFSVLRYGDHGSWVLLASAGPAAVSLLVVAHLARLIRERQRLEYLSTHDSLTGLPNRTEFYDRLALLLGRTAGPDGPAVVFLDLDRFKHINDHHGHDAGDELLREVALRLRQSVRADDTVARLAGDEFAILLAAPAGLARAEDVAQRILRNFAAPFHVTGAALSVSASMGMALAPDHGSEVETLLRNADSAMYAAKASGRNTSRAFQPGMASAAERHLLLEKRFRQAIADQELVVYYQPRVDTHTRRIVGVEALVRWDHPRLGLIPPAAFIPMAESTGAIAELGAWVMHKACADAAAWRRAGSSLAVSVNVSPRQFALQDVPAIVSSALRCSGLPAEALELEITESMHLSDDGSVTVALRHLNALGVVCAVDDFGTGYSSIAVLRDYPIGVVKLDRSFVQPVGESVDALLVKGVVQLARGLGMRVVAEGVETEAQMDFVAGVLCDEVQGFLVSRAVPAVQIMTALLQGGGDPTAVPSVVPVLHQVDERGLTELLWAEQEERDRVTAKESGEPRLAVALGSTAMLLTVPFVLGMGAGGGLPPLLQAGLTSTVQAVGAEPPRLAHHKVEASGRGRGHSDPATNGRGGVSPDRAHGSDKPAVAPKAPRKARGTGPGTQGNATTSGGGARPGKKPSASSEKGAGGSQDHVKKATTLPEADAQQVTKVPTSKGLTPGKVPSSPDPAR